MSSKKENDPLLVNSMTQQIKAFLDMHSNGNMNNTLYAEVKTEALRFFAYLFFWIMAIVATLLTEFVVRDRLLAGPEPGEPICPPFDSKHGFDISTDSHLIRVYGFNNICSNWDYSPAREIVAFIYPIFEYTLLLYLIADFVNTIVAYNKGWVSTRYYQVARILFPIMIALCSWFRMIFVILVYKNARGHTAGFVGLQLALVMVACLNVWFVLETKMEYPFLGGRRGTVLCALVYLVCDVIVSGLKFWLDVHVVAGFSYPSWGMARVGNHVVGEIIDYVWMVFNAILPLFISYVRSKTERPLEITVDVQPPEFALLKVQHQDETSGDTGA